MPKGQKKQAESKRAPKVQQIYRFDFSNQDEFKKALIENNRGNYLFLVYCQNIENISVRDFAILIPEQVQRLIRDKDLFFHYYFFGDEKNLLIGLASATTPKKNFIPNIDGAMGKVYADSRNSGLFKFSFGVARTHCNAVSDSDEIFHELLRLSQQNLEDNLIRWSWTKFNHASDFFAAQEAEAVIQPIVHFDHHNEIYTVRGGEVFVGGKSYRSYNSLVGDIPAGQDLNRIELLILEKLVAACKGAPGLLKFNVSPQNLIDTFQSQEKVDRFHQMLLDNDFNPLNVRIELIESPYEEKDHQLKDVCRMFWQHGISFAADDFGVKSQSHQVILDLGEMIKEFKLDPISFKFKPEEDHTKFLDNLAFIDYCKRLSDNREAIITAEAVDDYDTLRFLIAHGVYHFQTNIFCQKMSLKQYTETFEEKRQLPEEVVRTVLSSDELLKKQRRMGNIFRLATKHGLV